MTTPDVKVLIGEVAARHGIALRPDDPAFAIVTVNQLVLGQVMDEFVQRAREMTQQFEQAAVRSQVRAGTALAIEIHKAVAESCATLTQNIADVGRRHSLQAAHNGGSRVEMCRWLRVRVFSALALFLLGVLVGRTWL